MSKIQWTERTWNPVVGCSVVSPGCTNCYAMRQAARLLDKPGSHYEGTTQVANGKPVWTGKLALAPTHILTAPLRWKKPSLIFVNSMGDLFHEEVPHDWLSEVWHIMHGAHFAHQHVFQILTKRPERVASALGPKGIGWYAVEGPVPYPEPGIWLGASVEDRARMDRIDVLRQIPAVIRFLSLEPLLQDLGEIDLTGIHWVIIGGESGPGARPFELAWARSIIAQCRAAGVPVFMKQVGAFAIGSGGQLRNADRKGGDMSEWPEDLRVREFPNIGRELP